MACHGVVHSGVGQPFQWAVNALVRRLFEPLTHFYQALRNRFC
jgi:hypothetical protein